MTGNDQKIVWEHHLGVRTIILGCLGVHMGDFHVIEHVVGPTRRAKYRIQNPQEARGSEHIVFVNTETI